MIHGIIKIQKCHKGFSLIELIISLAIIGLVGLLVSQFFLTGIKLYSITSANIETQRDARVILDVIIKYLRQATSESIELTNKAAQPPYSYISFTTIAGKSFQFYQVGNKLYLACDGSTRVLSQNLYSLTFAFSQFTDLSNVYISLSTKKKTYSGQSSVIQLTEEKVRIMN